MKLHFSVKRKKNILNIYANGIIYGLTIPALYMWKISNIYL